MKLDSFPTEAGAASIATSSHQNKPSDMSSTDPAPRTGTPIGFAYNVPDGFERNREVIRSEMMFFNTPLTEKYSAEVYSAVQNIQDQCSADYRSFCPASAPNMNLNSLLAQLLVPMESQRIFRGRRLESFELKTGADYIGYLRSFFTPFHLHFQGIGHPLSAAVYRDPQTGKFKAVESTRDRMPASEKVVKPNSNSASQHVEVRSHAHTVPKVEHHHHHEHRRLTEAVKGNTGRKAAPGWKQPSTSAGQSNMAIKPTNPEPQAHVNAHTVPKVEHHNLRTDRQLREGAPGWHQPPAPPAEVHAVVESRIAAPGWKPSLEASDKAIKPTNPTPQSQELHMLRSGAPGWHQPPPAASATLVGGPAVDVMAPNTIEPHTEPAFFKSLEDTEDMPQQPDRPCNKPFQGLTEPHPQQQGSLSSAGFRPVSFFFSPGGFFASQPQVAAEQEQQQPGVGGDFRSFIMNFLSGRDGPLSLVSPFTISVRTPALKSSDDDVAIEQDDDNQAAEDDGYYYSYYSYDDDGANYSYDDALLLDDEDAGDDTNTTGDDDFFAQRFFLPPSTEDVGEKPPSLPEVDHPPAVQSKLVQWAARQRAARGEIPLHHEEDGSSDEDEGEAEDSEGSEDESENHHHDHHRTKGLKGIKSRLSAIVHAHHDKHTHNSKQQLDHKDHHHDHPGPGGDKDEHDHHHDHDRDDPRRGPRGPPDEHRPDPHGPPPPPPPPPHHPPFPVPEDHSFYGNLGFGADGDMCMYRAMSQGRVSQPCVGAVSDLYELRAQYWEESQQPQDFHHHHGLGLLILGVVLLACTVRRIYAVRYEKKVRSLLTALHTHPHLKSSIETETGVEVPVPVPAGTCCIGATTEGESSRKVLVKVGQVIVFGLLVFAVSFFIAFSALEITMRVVNEMDEHAPEDPVTGEPAYTSPLTALFVLFFVCTAELTVLALLVRGVKACFKRNSGTSTENVSSSPSAPFDPRGPSSRSSRLSQHAQQILASLPPALFGRSRQQPPADGYSPLLGEDSVHGARDVPTVVGTEMTSMRTSHAYPVQQPQQQYVPVYVPMGPVTASPIGAHSINMV